MIDLPAVFFEIHLGLPREAPGDDESTRRALRLCELPADIDMLDVGCGPGGQTVVAAQEFAQASVVAIDLHRPFLDEVWRRAETDGVADRVHPVHADMQRLPVADGGFDLILAEGSAYVIGIHAALSQWRALLRQPGYIVFSELVWLTDNRPEEAAAFFNAEYPPMTTPGVIVKTIDECGYVLVGRFTLPDESWWVSYYAPMEKRIEELRVKYAGDDDALGVIEESQKEIDIRRRYGDSYGYEFFVVRMQAGMAGR